MSQQPTLFRLPRLRASIALGCACVALAFASREPSITHESAGGKIEWTADLEQALARAASEKRVVMVALGEAGEGRTARHLKSLYPSKAIAAHVGQTINVPAWSFDPDEKRALPRLAGITERDHMRNLGLTRERWVTPNELGIIALPQHIWLSPGGDVLLSCPWEIDAQEFAWCCDEALRRAGIEERPEAAKGAHPPRRLLLGETYRVLDDDKLGRGLKPEELEESLGELKKRFLSMGDREVLTRILFTDDDDAADFMMKQLGLWDMGGAGTGGIVDGTIALTGLISPALFLEILEDAASSNSESRRAQVAVAYEQFGSPEGLATVKKALKKEKVASVRAEWARALGACGRGEKSVAKALIRAARKDKSARVRRSAIIGLGHVLPEASAQAFLEETVTAGGGLEREAAIVALALGRAVSARGVVAAVSEEDIEASTAGAVDAALAVLDGGNLHLIEAEVRRISESEIDRGRIFFRATGVVLPGGGR